MEWFLILTIYINAPGEGVNVVGSQQVQVAMPSQEVCEEIAELQIDKDAECWARKIRGAPEAKE